MDKIVEKITEKDFEGLRIPFIAVYENPKDYPGKCVARIYDTDKPTNVVLVRDTYDDILKEAEAWPASEYIAPGGDDDPCLLGVWL